MEEKQFFNAINLLYKPYQSSIFKLYQKLGNFKRVFEELKIKDKIDIEKEFKKS
jgi:hypothetical protein